MSPAIAFDTLVYAKKLKSVGFTEAQAEALAESQAQLIESRLATKQDIELVRRDMKELEASLKRDMKELEVSLKGDMKASDVSLKRDLKEMEMRLTIRMGILIAASIAIVATLVKLL
jgi:predicted phage-related endonuclease